MTGSLIRQVAANVRELRKARGVSQEKFGDEIGIHRTYLGRIENAKENLSLEAVERLAERLDVRPIDLLDGDIARGRVDAEPGPTLRAAAEGVDPGSDPPPRRRPKPKPKPKG